MRRGFVCLLTVAAMLCAVFATPARAETAEAQVERLANEAVAAYRAADYKGAVTLLERAYAIRQVAALLYNTAKAYDKLGDPEKSLDLYRRYVASDDADVKLKAKATSRIVALEPIVAAMQKPVEPPKPVVVEPPKPVAPAGPTPEDRARRVRTRDRIIALSVGVVGVALLATMTGAYVHADDLHGEFSRSRDELEKRPLKDSAKRYALAGDVCLGVGVAAAGVAAYFTYRGFRPEKKRATAVLPLWLADGGGIAVGGTF